MSSSPFHGCWLRIERADSHRETFAKTRDRFLEGRPYRAAVQMEDDGTGRILVTIEDSLPVILALELGEMLYQLRSSLDGCIYQAAILDSGQNPPPDEKHLEFPICATAEDFENSARKIRPLSDERKVFIESIQPYNAPELTAQQQSFNFNIALGILHDWARKDRHRRLHLVGAWASGAQPKIRLPEGTSLASMDICKDGFLEDENTVCTFTIGGWVPGMKVEGNPDLTIDITADEIPGPRWDGDTLSHRCEAMIRACKAIVGSIESSFDLLPR